jgi:serine/threonine protein kinase
MSLVTARRSVAAPTSGQRERPPIPQQIGKYRVLFELGRGGMATVYLAAAQSAAGVTKLVVLKALLPEFAGEVEARSMFLDEARLAAQLNHGNIVQTYEVGEEGDRHVIVMEYLEGQSLASVLRRAQQRGVSLPLGLYLRVLMHVLEGLHYTHELRDYDGTPLSPVHRDVSPQNVFITYDGRVKVLDFGIAKAASSTTHTTNGLIKGKIAYMSPEQMTGGALDRRADVYAVGCMLWSAVTGRKLWADATDVSIMHSVINDAIPTPCSQSPDCDPELERIVMKALARAPSRYASALQLHEELERFCEAHGLADRPRELARVMAELFGDDRAELGARIDRELSLVRSGISAAMPKPALAAEGRAAGLEQQQVHPSIRTIAGSTLNAASSKSPGARLRWPWWVAAATALASMIYWVLPRVRHQPPVRAGVALAPAPARAVEKEPENVKIELRSNLPAAQLFLDDQAVQGNPALRIFPKDGRVHRLRAELAGYRVASGEFAANADQVLELKLEELPRQPSGKPSVAPRAAVPSKASSPTSARSPNCAQPFHVGADGIKRIKPSCF